MVKRFIICGNMTIEKTYKLTIKDTAYFLTEQEVSTLYEQCRQALNISVTNPNWPSYPPGVRKFDDNTTPSYPSWPTYPLPNTYCGDMPFGTTTSGTTDNSVMDTGNGLGIKCANIPTSKGINFLSKENDNWRSSVQQALDKLSVKTNVTKSDGTKIR